MLDLLTCSNNELVAELERRLGLVSLSVHGRFKICRRKQKSQNMWSNKTPNHFMLKARRNLPDEFWRRIRTKLPVKLHRLPPDMYCD